MTSKIRSRNGISIRGITYRRLQEHCKTRGESISGFLEAIIAKDLDARGVPEVEAVPKPKRSAAPPKATEGVGGVHNF
jgi:hypothetical protein